MAEIEDLFNVTANEISTVPPIAEDRLQQMQWTFGNHTAAQTKNVDDFFLLTMGGLVYLMQPGFAFLEAGTVRSKNVTNTLFRNMLGSFIACMSYWLFGFAFGFGEPSNAFVGYGNFALSDESPQFSLWFFEFVFAAATNSIVSGAIAERIDIFSYFIYSMFVPSWIYAVITHWTWTEKGWLKNLKFDNVPGTFQDFAGSGGVHVCGGICALAGAIALGPRIGRFPKSKDVVEDNNGTSDFRSHSVPLVILGGFLLMFAFFGFNGGSQLHISMVGDGQIVSAIVVNTIVSGSLGGIASILCARMFKSRWSVLHGLNGALAAMVAICSGCDVMYPWAAAVTGFVAGIAYSMWSLIIPKLGIDDPLDTVALHAGGGSWGVIATAIFDKNHGLVYVWNKASLYALGYQFLGLAAIIAWSFCLAIFMFGLLRIYRSRVAKDIEITGLDEVRHKEPAYIKSTPEHSTTTSPTIRPTAYDHTASYLKGFFRGHHFFPHSTAGGYHPQISHSSAAYSHGSATPLTTAAIVAAPNNGYAQNGHIYGTVPNGSAYETGKRSMNSDAVRY